MLSSLGFGSINDGQDYYRRIPDRFLSYPSKAQGITLSDILEQLLRPGRDPRADLPPPVLRSDVLSMEDLTVGLQLDGTVRNVVDFGAFIDIGVKQDGLLPRSKIPRGVQLGVGDVISVEILRVEAERGRISLGWPNSA